VSFGTFVVELIESGNQQFFAVVREILRTVFELGHDRSGIWGMAGCVYFARAKILAQGRVPLATLTLCLCDDVRHLTLLVSSTWNGG